MIIAIQNNERAVLESLAPSLPVITSGVDFDIVADPGVPTDPAVLCVASGNPMNRRGLQDFLEFAWPRVRERVPAAELKVVGAVGESIGVPPPGVTILGTVADLGPLYSASRVVINPTVAGTESRSRRSRRCRICVPSSPGQTAWTVWHPRSQRSAGPSTIGAASPGSRRHALRATGPRHSARRTVRRCSERATPGTRLRGARSYPQRLLRHGLRYTSSRRRRVADT